MREVVGPCEIPTNKPNQDGYVPLTITVAGTRKKVYAHRLAYETRKGPIPAGMVLDHLCRNRACRNPDHLEPVTNRTNVVERGNTITAAYAKRSHCKNGHELVPVNVGRYPSRPNARVCRECKRVRDRRRSRRGSA